MTLCRCTVALVVISVAAACSVPAARPEQPTIQFGYVAFGDSAAAAPFVPDPAEPLGCLKSTNNYPNVVARRIAPGTFIDVTCSGARTDDVVNRSQQTRQGQVPPQLDAVDSDTDLITITIGANDVELSSTASTCRISSLDEEPCVDTLVTDDGDRIADAINNNVDDWAAMIDAVRAKVPNARIIMVGYGTYIRPGGCFPEQPIHPRDADYFQAKIDELATRQQQLAIDKGIEYFDIRALSVGHDMCAPPDDRYFEGFVLANPAAPLHPNGIGAAAIGNALADHIG